MPHRYPAEVRHQVIELWMTDNRQAPDKEGKVYCCVVLDAPVTNALGMARGLVPSMGAVDST